VQILTPIGVLDREKQLGVIREITDIVAAAADDPSLAEHTWGPHYRVAGGRMGNRRDGEHRRRHCRGGAGRTHGKQGGIGMKAIGLTEFGGPEVVKAVDLPEPEPAPGEVRIRVHAVAVNPTDITFRMGGRASQLAERPTPYVHGMDGAGIVDKLGEGTERPPRLGRSA
jgi:hypothetical protein